MSVLFLCFAMTATALTASALLNTSLPAYILGLGGTTTQIGMLYATTAATSMVLRPVVGGLVDRHGPKPVLTFGVLSLAATSVAFQFVHRPWALVVLMVGVGASIGLVATSSAILVARSAPPERRGESLTVYYLSNSVPIALGPVLGLAVLADAGMRTNFVVVTVLALVIGLVAAAIPKGAAGQRPVQQTGPRFISLRHPSLMAALVLSSMGEGTLYAFVPLHAVASGTPAPAWFFVTQSACLIGSRLVFRRASDRFGRYRVLAPAIIAVSTGFFLLSRPATLPVLGAAAVLIGLGQSFLYPTLLALAVDRTPPEEIGVTTGTFSASYDFASVAGSLTMGAIVQRTSYGTGFLFMGTAVVGGLAFLAYDYFRHRAAAERRTE
jgi:MFS family permease